MFYDTLNNLLKKHGISKTKLSNDLKIGKNQIKYWEKTGIMPNGDTLVKLADYFGVSTDYLLGITDERTPRTKDTPEMSAAEKRLAELLRAVPADKLDELCSLIEAALKMQGLL